MRATVGAQARLCCLGLLWVVAAVSCGEDIEVGADRPTLTQPDSSTPDSSTAGAGDGGACGGTRCGGRLYACDDCIDNDADGFVDLEDPDCLGPCQVAEDSFFGPVSVQAQGRCAQDCYFDDDSGFGNDGCNWSHHCDGRSRAPDYPPEGEECAYSPDEPIQGTSGVSCQTAEIEQSSVCLETCLPLTPPGCDCFGCCVLIGAPTPIWIGSNDGNVPTCSLSSIADRALCRPCTQVTSCLRRTL